MRISKNTIRKVLSAYDDVMHIRGFMPKSEDELINAVWCELN